MSSATPRTVVRFRANLLIAMMLVITALTAATLYFAQRNAAIKTEQDLHREFQTEIAAVRKSRDIRQAALVERCRALVGKARIHAALEDNALDLLYPSARDELRDVMESETNDAAAASRPVLEARLYRFLDAQGKVITPPDQNGIGVLNPEEEAQLSLPGVPMAQQIGYVAAHTSWPNEPIVEIITMPIVSNESGNVIAALAIGFAPIELSHNRSDDAIKRGIWLNQRLHLSSVDELTRTTVEREVSSSIAAGAEQENSFRVNIGTGEHLLFYKQLNPQSLYSPAYEVCIYPLTGLVARQRQLRWQTLGAGALLLIVGLVVSQIVSSRLSKPVEKLAYESAENRAKRKRAEAALESTSEELQRAARFSADASHQLKTPVTVLRAGLDELLARDDIKPEVRDEISALIHQTFRVTGIIEDLLLLSRMDAGRLQLEFSPVNLTLLIESWLDDFEALPDGSDVKVEANLPPDLYIEGEKRYTSLILQNLLENARKYNRPGGRIRISAEQNDGWVLLRIGNTSDPIAPAVREHIFDRFHRGEVGENVPGYGLGLNLARELARIHQGDVRLVRSENGWTEFEVRFRLSTRIAANGAAAE